MTDATKHRIAKYAGQCQLDDADAEHICDAIARILSYFAYQIKEEKDLPSEFTLEFEMHEQNYSCMVVGKMTMIEGDNNERSNSSIDS